MRKLLIFFLIIFTPIFAKQHSVICIHGFLGGRWTMHYLGKNIRREGFDVLNWKYPSSKHSIRFHSETLIKELKIISEQKPNEPIHFVSHSMGALVLLAALNHPDCPEEAKIGRVVLISPPINGSKWGRWLYTFSLIKWLAKGPGKELMTKQDFSYLGKYPDSLESILVIAGTLGFNPILPGKNDGTISLDETDISVPHEKIIINRGHKTIVFSKKVCRIIMDFLNDDPDKIVFQKTLRKENECNSSD